MLHLALGMDGAASTHGLLLLVRALLPLVACQVFSVACNDLSDMAIDAVNLAGDPSRPLVFGGTARRDMVGVAVGAAVVALGAAAFLGLAPFAVVAAELVVGAAYSLRPVRLAERGALAAVTLAVCFVVLPYLLGRVVVGAHLSGRDALMVAGLSLGFVGRIVLKDFRDVRGDTMYGKRTFLVRRGRARTCRFSAGCWTAGTGAMLVATPHPGAVLTASILTQLAAALWLLDRLRTETHPRRETMLISTIAIVGRGMLLTLLTHLALLAEGWSAAQQAVTIAALLALTLGQSHTMLTRGPATRLVVPPALLQPGPDLESSEWSANSPNSPSTAPIPAPWPDSGAPSSATRSRTKKETTSSPSAPR
ncbi:hypothetical protein GCM10009839_48620 [Catenulispora yoronensis]|uniref:4-hydroxybenzoate polyprenyltransferase n=2 Tax=Catenulispora yoronensis TaxID=450799 RepID=A0ABP5G6C9_9ACTN